MRKFLESGTKKTLTVTMKSGGNAYFCPRQLTLQVKKTHRVRRVSLPQIQIHLCSLFKISLCLAYHPLQSSNPCAIREFLL